MADAIENALALSDTEINIMGNNGKRLVNEKYKDTQVATMMKQLYEWILNHRKKQHSYMNNKIIKIIYQQLKWLRYGKRNNFIPSNFKRKR